MYVLQMQQRGTNDFFSSSLTPVRFVSLLNCAISKPGLDRVSENALSGASIKHVMAGMGSSTVLSLRRE